ncbi:hypothetical protein [Enterobacter cloacae]|uniref:hypothetical protein n=1 Tax=Enterobacter cloacae TaxID=550 RepID=UPI002A801F8C|nr:hypothetical protein [Enterobacter cloacae]
MSNIDKRAQKELYAKVEQQAHSLRGSPREYQALTGLCPVNVIEMQAQKIQALLDELEAKDKLNAELMEKQRLIDICQGQGLEHRIAAEKRAEEAEKRVAELEVREVVLPQRYSMLHRVDFNEPYHTEMVYKQHQVLEALHDAGVNVAAAGKGE